MDSQSPEFKAYQEILEGHRELKALLQEIDDALAARTATIAAVSDLLARLGDKLIKHFALEEGEGYFSAALLNAPQLIAKANELLAQHPKMCTQARTMAENLTSGTDSDRWWQETHQRFQAFRAELLKHERNEDKLLQEAYTQDIGSHD